MKIKEIISVIGAKVITGQEIAEGEVNSIMASDLMSDVLKYSSRGNIVDTIVAVAGAYPDVRIIYIHTREGRRIEFDSRQELGPTPDYVRIAELKSQLEQKIRFLEGGSNSQEGRNAKDKN